jgi:hypothetical protein
MAHKVIDRCKETTSSTGTGNLTLTGAVSGFVSMANAATGLTSNGDTGWFCAEAGAQWEVFLGTRISATELERTTLLASSTGSTINFSSAPAVFSTVPAARMPAAMGPAARAYLSADQTLTAATWTKINLNTESFDIGGCFDTGTSKFTPTVPGIYRIEACLLGTSSGTMSDISINIYKNGAKYSDGGYGTSGAEARRVTTADLVSMNGTSDYIELYGFINGSGTLKAISTSSETRLSVSLVTATG